MRGKPLAPLRHTNQAYEVAVDASGSHRPLTIGTRSTNGLGPPARCFAMCCPSSALMQSAWRWEIIERVGRLAPLRHDGGEALCNEAHAMASARNGSRRCAKMLDELGDMSAASAGFHIGDSENRLFSGRSFFGPIRRACRAGDMVMVRACSDQAAHPIFRSSPHSHHAAVRCAALARAPPP